MNRKMIIGTSVAVITSVALLAGCGSNSSSSKIGTNHGSSSNSYSANRNDSNGTTSTNSADTALWNSGKSAKLATYIDAWGPTMDQSYQQYKSGDDVDFYGYNFPSDFANTQVSYEGSNYNVKMSTTGEGSSSDTFNVVALYSDVDSIGGRPGGYLYLFAFKNGKPYTLVSDQTNGGGALKVTETANQDIDNAFKKIVNGGTPSSPDGSSSSESKSSSSAKSSKIDDKTTGVLVSLLANPDWFKSCVEGSMWYGTNDTDSDEVQGYSYMTANGDPTSYIYYKVNGDVVTYKQWMPRDSVADGYFETKTATISRLENDYYSTKSEKSEVQNYVNEIKPESSYDDGE